MLNEGTKALYLSCDILKLFFLLDTSKNTFDYL